jgi:N-acetylmuramic acid 6-phosphate etherase
MSTTSLSRSGDFLGIAGQFKLGALVTESSHPVTADLSDTARGDTAAALRLLFAVDDDVVRAYGAFVESGRAAGIAGAVLNSLRRGGRIFFTGCGSTGRLSIQLVSIWRDFWQRQRACGLACAPSAADWEDRAFSVMAGGDFALIKAVEGFEDFTAFGKKQIGDLGVSDGDVVFAITEGGETSFVIGTAWKGVEAGAKVYFVYNNPDDILCAHVVRSREVIEDVCIEKINLTTGPMAITGSTRMQATTIQLCVMLTVMEMVLRELMRDLEPGGPCALDATPVPRQFLAQLVEMHTRLREPSVLERLAALVSLEETTYRAGRKHNYYADRFGIDVLTDTTERSPTYCTPPFRKFDDTTATESWAFLFVPDDTTPGAWEHLIKRAPACVEWSDEEVQALVSEDKLKQTLETVRKISRRELMRFKVGLDGLPYRRLGPGDSAVAIVGDADAGSLLEPGGFYRARLEEAREAGARTGVLAIGRSAALERIREGCPDPACVTLAVRAPDSDFLLDGVVRAGLKMLLNALSTCTMVRLGRVMGNYMVWLVASNLKLIDRATRYIEKLAGLEYVEANRLLFEVVEYVEPRMKADQAYPPVVGLAVTRAQSGLGNEDAERVLMTGQLAVSGQR